MNALTNRGTQLPPSKIDYYEELRDHYLRAMERKDNLTAIHCMSLMMQMQFEING